MRLRTALLASAVCLFFAQFAAAADAPSLKVGSRNVAVIEPPVAHPAEAPCVVPLYHGAQFGANNYDIAYNPPANCPGPYATIVLSVDISLNKGIQYDRTGTIWLGGVPLWFGTTAEPDPKLGPSWHFERDVTDYTSLLNSAQTGYVLIANYTNSQDTSIITSSGKLLFYPATANYPAPTVPDMIVPLAAPGGGTIGLNTGKDKAVIDQSLPTNIRRAALDVYLQGQSNDEFWYTCVPNKLASELESCGGGSFREGEISVDGMPAGVAPVFPWIFTGGIDPYLWAPIPGVQTLDFKPFRVELSPFAGVLSDALTKHKITLQVHGANSYFSVAGALMLYLDSGVTQVSGSVTQNTLTAKPMPVITKSLKTDNGDITGDLDTTAQRNFTIAGTVVDSAGTEQVAVTQLGDFANDQTFDITDSVYKQLISQTTDTAVQTTVTGSSGTNTYARTYHYPLTVDIVEKFLTDGNLSLLSTIGQSYQTNGVTIVGGVENTNSLQDSINSQDKLILNSSFQIVGHGGMQSTANYATSSSTVPCFGRTLTAAKNVLT
ncbi:MAG TPA: peptide-N4-asparagine amidase, partial [Acetobacteraceae bacterium]|nr:peptide-N4-asparagine amidase [Acetobacteraceae bacterium]